MDQNFYPKPEHISQTKKEGWLTPEEFARSLIPDLSKICAQNIRVFMNDQNLTAESFNKARPDRRMGIFNIYKESSEQSLIKALAGVVEFVDDVTINDVSKEATENAFKELGLKYD